MEKIKTAGSTIIYPYIHINTKPSNNLKSTNIYPKNNNKNNNINNNINYNINNNINNNNIISNNKIKQKGKPLTSNSNQKERNIILMKN